MPPSGIQWGLMPWKELIPKLLLFAHRRGRRRSILITKADLSDLVAEAVEKTLNGTRQWEPLKCGLYEHLAGIISSLLYNETRKTLLRPMVHLDEALVAEIKEQCPSPEEDFAYRSEIAAFVAFIAAKDAELLEFLNVSLHEENEPLSLACLLNMPIEQVYYKRKRLKKMLRDQQQQSCRSATQAA